MADVREQPSQFAIGTKMAILIWLLVNETAISLFSNGLPMVI